MPDSKQDQAGRANGILAGLNIGVCRKMPNGVAMPTDDRTEGWLSSYCDGLREGMDLANTLWEIWNTGGLPVDTATGDEDNDKS